MSLEGDNTPTLLSVTQYTNFTNAFFTFKTSHGSTVQAYCDVDARKKCTTPFVKNSDAEFYENPTNDIADVPMSRTDGRGIYFVKKAYEEHQLCAATNCRPETHVRSYRRCGQPIGPKILLVLLHNYTRAKGCAQTSVSTNQCCVTFHNKQRLSYTAVEARHLAHCQIDHPNCTNCLPEAVRCRVGSSAGAITSATVKVLCVFPQSFWATTAKVP